MTAKKIYSNVANEQVRARALPAAAYLDQQVFEGEVEQVMRRRWLPVARLSDVANRGDYHSSDPLGVPLVITRDNEGAINVVSRICQHRAMPIVEGAGNTLSLNCPYHLWRYGLDGEFLTAPAMNRSEVFEGAQCNLPQVRHEEWGGWVFVNLSGDAEPLETQLRPLAERLQGLRLEEMVRVNTMEFRSPWNWKVMVENFMESYHHMGPHAESLQPANPALTTYANETHGAFSILENPPSGEGFDPFVVGCIFPYTLFAVVEGDLPTAVWYELSDVEVDRFLLRIHILVLPEVADDPEVISGVTETIRFIHGEDIPFCEGVQKGLSSPLYRSGPLSHLEGCLWHFHKFLSGCFERA